MGAQTNIQKPKITKPKKEGYLEKQSSFWKTYRKRWMVLQGYMLYSFKEEKEYDNPTEIFDLRIYNKAKKSSDGKTGQFELSSPNDCRIFLASSENEMKDWIKYIKSASNSKKKAASVAITKNSKRNLSTKTNPHSASSKVSASKKNRKKKVSSSKTSTKKKPKQSPKQTPKSSPKGKAISVTNNSMNKHIERMNKLQASKQTQSHSKSRS